MRGIQESISQLLDGFNVIVTGGGQGLGVGSARWLAQAGARVFIADKDGPKAEKAAASLPGNGHLAWRCDVTCHQNRRNLIEAVKRTVQEIHVLVNNAGITYIAPVEETDESKWRTVFDVNVHGLMFMACEVGKLMLSQGTGSMLVDGWPPYGPDYLDTASVVSV